MRRYRSQSVDPRKEIHIYLNEFRLIITRFDQQKITFIILYHILYLQKPRRVKNMKFDNEEIKLLDF